jgi:diacylglycerol O-acyltransferase-1
MLFSGVLVRLSSENEAEAAQWVELLTLACALASGSGAQPIEQDYKISKITNPTNIAVEDGDSPEGSPSSSLRLRKSISLQREHSKDAKQKGRDMAATYPASRPMHMCNQPSLLSEESPRQNYRGALNLAFIILVMTHFRLIIENLLKYGILLKPSMPEMLNWENLEGVLHMPLFGLVVFNLFGLVALATETLAAKGIVKDRLALNIQVCNCTLALLIPTFGVYFSTLHPLAGMLFLGEAVVLWLKLVSYAHANRDLRIARDMGYYQRPTEGQDAAAGSKFGRSQVENLENPVDYPDNLTVSNLYYFLLAPTLSYQLNYPRSPSIRWNNVLSYTSRLLFSIGLIIFVVEQYVSPLLKSSIKPIHKLQVCTLILPLLLLMQPSSRTSLRDS